jgi:hypothetical protein
MSEFDYMWLGRTITNAFSTLTVPITIHTSETGGALLYDFAMNQVH